MRAIRGIMLYVNLVNPSFVNGAVVEMKVTATSDGKWVKAKISQLQVF